MRYRTYIGWMPKREYNKIKSMSSEQLKDFYKIEIEEDGYWYKGVYEYGNELHEFGKYTDFNPPKKSLKPFFKNKEIMMRYEEYDFYIITPEFLEYIIETYKKKVCDYYNDMMNPFFGGDLNEKQYKDEPTEFLNSAKMDYNFPNTNYSFDFSKITQKEQNSIWKMIDHVRGMRSEWVNLTPYNLKEGEEVSNSWKYEYAIFELVRIYKSFDWKRKVMIYYGY